MYPDDFKKLVRKTAEELRSVFYLGEYSMDILYVAEEEDDTCADIMIDHVYLNLKIRIYPSFYRDYKEDKYFLKKYLIHEFSHAIIHPIQHLLKELQKGNLITEREVTETIERQTQRLTNIFCDLLKIK